MYIYIYIQLQKRQKKYTYSFPAAVVLNRRRIPKLKIENDIHYKPEKGTFQTVNKFFSC